MQINYRENVLIKSSKSVSIEAIKLGLKMKKIIFLVVGFIVVSSCGGGHGLYSKPGDYLGGNEAAAIELACRNRGSNDKDSSAYDLCVQSQKIHYK